MQPKTQDIIPAHPVKSFFVHMLTRDIHLQDAVLDLLDNCVDGIQRTASDQTLGRKTPYKGYWAKITFSADKFCIEDNCGGIPWRLHDYAFRMGRSVSMKENFKGRLPVGTYGIGMKRAIFKIGNDCTVTTHSSDRSYKVRFTSEWIKSEDDWQLTSTPIKKSNRLGTAIEISKIKDSIKNEFQSKVFLNSFKDAVSSHYAYIIDKGFEIFVNGVKVAPKSIKLIFSKIESQPMKDCIRPFIYKANYNGLNIFLAVGFASPIPSKEEVDSGMKNFKERHSSADAGWTVICNDRTVLYCDKTSLTGWGVSGIPQYHTQFIAISGIVLFNSEDPKKLPTTTTKRGIDASSDVYLHVRDKMIEGIKIFTQYTNEWKTKELIEESRTRFKKSPVADILEIKSSVPKLKMSVTKGPIKGMQYKPPLPRPTTKKTIERIAFTRPVREVRRVSSYLFYRPDVDPRKVGEKCFEIILEEAE